MRKNKFCSLNNLFLILATLFVGTAVFVMPINRVPDEMNHARMAWNILYKETPESIKWMALVDGENPVQRQPYKEAFTEKIDFKNEEFQLNFSLHSIAHIPQMIGMLIGRVTYPSIGVMVTLGRIMNALVYILGVYFLLNYLRYGKKFLFFIALLPIMAQQAGSLSYDVVNFLVISAFFGFLTHLSLDKTLTKKNLVQLAVLTLGLYATKMNNLLLFGLIFTIPFHFSGILEKFNSTLNKIRQFIHKYKYILGSLLVLSVIVVSFLFFQQRGGNKHIIKVMLNTLFNNQLNDHLNTVLTVGMFGFLGNFKVQIPLWLIFIDVVILTLLAMEQPNDKQLLKVDKNFSLAAGWMFPLQVFCISLGMYFAWTIPLLGQGTIISVGAQGRYFTPFLIFFVPFFMKYSSNFMSTNKEQRLTKWMVCVLLLNYVVTLWLVLQVYWP